MPGFAGSLNDEQLTELLNYVRSHFSNKPPWSGIEKDIRDAKTWNRPVMMHPPHGFDPADTSQYEAQR
jgi:hypothetical protein